MTDLVIFDMDGLMFDTEVVGREVMKKVLANYGYTLTDDFYLELVGTNGETAKQKILEHFGQDYPYEEIDRQTHELLLETIDSQGLIIKPGLETLLTYLKQKHIACCVASSSSRTVVCHYLDLAGLQDAFAFIVCGDEVTNTKPHPEIFLKALAKAQANCKNALVLEDSKNGILASTKAKIPVICIPDLKTPEPNIQKLCQRILPSLFEVIDYLEGK